MPAVRKVVYVDTNVVLEAHRTGCWADLVERFDVRTVELIQIEAQSGDRRQRGYVTVNMREFCAKVTVSKVTDVHRLRASARAPALTALDAGELDLLAFVASEDPGSLLLTTADKAAIKTACQLGLEAQLVSLEEMAKQRKEPSPQKAVHQILAGAGANGISFRNRYAVIRAFSAPSLGCDYTNITR